MPNATATRTEMTESPAGTAATAAPATREEGRYLTPPVDIYETENDLVVLVDLPGVGQDGVDVRVDDGLLTIQGRTTPRRGDDPVYREFGLVSFHRQFQLSDQVDHEKITGELRHGVLTVRLPKAEKVKPRRVQVTVAS